MNFVGVTGTITAIVFALILSGNGKMVKKAVLYGNHVVLKEVMKPWPSTSIFLRHGRGHKK